MTREELSGTLASLHEKLNDTTDVDEETRALLLSVTADIERLLAKKSDAKDLEETDESYSQQIKDMISKFEARHPLIGGLLERLSDGLANMGI